LQFRPSPEVTNDIWAAVINFISLWETARSRQKYLEKSVAKQKICLKN